MRYTIIAPESESRLAVVDARENGDFEVTCLDEKGQGAPSLLTHSRVTVKNGQLEAILGEPAGTRMVFPVFCQQNDGVFVVASSLGNFRLLPTRGVLLESNTGAAAGGKSIKSSMPGKVLKILCKAGDQIEAGQPLLIIEAMKMENEIRSPQAGVVEKIGVELSQSIQTGDLLVKLGKAQ